VKAICNAIKLQFNEQNKPEMLLSLTSSRQEIIPEVQELRDILVKGKMLAVEIKQHRVRRSLDANAYMWVLLSELAAALHTTKDELYLVMLERYGVFTHVVVKPNVVDRVKHEWRTVRELGEVTIKGQTGIQLQCFFGSSTYDTAEMARLIDGVISEAKELGIETLTPSELSILKQEWGK
jgi:hypothetical protein